MFDIFDFIGFDSLTAPIRLVDQKLWLIKRMTFTVSFMRNMRLFMSYNASNFCSKRLIYNFIASFDLLAFYRDISIDCYLIF